MFCICINYLFQLKVINVKRSHNVRVLILKTDIYIRQRIDNKSAGAKVGMWENSEGGHLQAQDKPQGKPA